MEKHIPIGPYYKVMHAPSEDVSIITLSPERINFLIFNTEFVNSLPQHLKCSRDRFLLGCLTALRYSDIQLLTGRNILKKEGDMYIQSTSKKTETRVLVKLPNYLEAIIDPDIIKTPSRKLFRPLSLTNFNKHLKEICERAGWTELVEKRRKVDGKSTRIRSAAKEEYRFCDLVSSHIMRRSAITNMLILGMSEHMVKSVSGHAKGSKDFYRYVNHVQPYLDKQLEMVHHKMEIMSNGR